MIANNFARLAKKRWETWERERKGLICLGNKGLSLSPESLTKSHAKNGERQRWETKLAEESTSYAESLTLPRLSPEKCNVGKNETATHSFTSDEQEAAVTEPLPTPPASPEPEPKDRLCYQCAHFDRSPYGFPLGLCQQHGNRLQHSTSQPVRFGCCHFVIRQPDDDSKTCLACCHYSLLSTMCDAVNTGCPYPAIPPCRGDRFEMKEVRS